MGRILFFKRGPLTAQDKAEAISKGLTLRSADAYREGDFLEQCDGVAGDAPQPYLDKFGFVDSSPAEEVAFAVEAEKNQPIVTRKRIRNDKKD